MKYHQRHFRLEIMAIVVPHAQKPRRRRPMGAPCAVIER
jgi:hypothetical protein